MPDQEQAAAALDRGRVVAAVERLDEDLALVEGLPVTDTRAAREAASATLLAVYRRFAASVVDAVGAEPAFVLRGDGGQPSADTEAGA